MIERGGGAICNLTSVHGLQGAAEHAAYAGTKGAIIAHTRALGVELAHLGVRVNAIAPGWIDVENHARVATDYDPEQAKKTAAQKVPVGHYGVPLDVARLAVFLCSDAASFIVGQTLVIDGGTTALMSLLADFRTPSAARYGQDYMRRDP
jgi:NAD(P)-dependent dehydrogenase (short-subunit alcohol dehydrogenase family)